MHFRRLVGLIVALLCLNAFAVDRPTLADRLPHPLPALTVGYYEFPPYTYTAADGSTRGSGAEMVRRILLKAGYRADFRPLPSARLYLGLQDGSVQLWAGAPGKPELLGSTLECERVLGHVELNLYRLASRPSPKLPEGLTTSRVILISGYSYWRPITEMLADPKLQLEVHRTSTHTAALQMLERGRGDYLIDYQTPVEQARRELNMAPLAFDNLYSVPTKLIVSRHAPDAEGLRAQLDHAYDELQSAGYEMKLP
ncbi:MULTISPECIES: substrate-binding periplasmic protein [unclassified Pseudomonas]|uniref:substrate-binding periplasmic protein n=1 Tax=unclassified Pseudomonas TaxID=196821 RepID=UPI0009DA82E5|nr:MULTISPECIES: transporter substrate-binding domain-containing protein [unclassified Pseudomonas]MBD9517811.1 bifunctional lytic transglycosylase/amino acid ABC transporter substrate-binding protein [Pseudomonas sp. PDM22]MBD9682434.1 bifunctional lytic transglycosylase/amino acid ABC transporter substrate-binding protein [Pseudomonas sp. PDM20]OQR34313.1 bifunctional lytic transglycosylase/amino acid ABC transporter substrate-binding protein [Pseudomonas sp. T]